MERLKSAGASNLYVYAPEDVHDTSEMIETEDGAAYQYAGHWSWIYFFNNEAADNESGLSAWDFIANHAK